MTDSVAEPHGLSPAEVQRAADEGNAAAMYHMGMELLKGGHTSVTNLNPKDVFTRAFVCFNKARVAGNVQGQAHAGWMMMLGHGIHKDTKRGLVWLTTAAMRGSDVAAYWIGNAFFDGNYGMTVDFREARSWFEKCLTEEECPIHNMSLKARIAAKKKIDWIKKVRPELYPTGTKQAHKAKGVSKRLEREADEESRAPGAERLFASQLAASVPAKVMADDHSIAVSGRFSTTSQRGASQVRLSTTSQTQQPPDTIRESSADLSASQRVRSSATSQQVRSSATSQEQMRASQRSQQSRTSAAGGSLQASQTSQMRASQRSQQSRTSAAGGSLQASQTSQTPKRSSATSQPSNPRASQTSQSEVLTASTTRKSTSSVAAQLRASRRASQQASATKDTTTTSASQEADDGDEVVM